MRSRRQCHSIDGQALVRERTKTGGHRTGLLDAITVAAICAWREPADRVAGAPTRWMLAEPGAADPPSPRWLCEVFMRAAKEAGIPAGRGKGIVLHDLRHWAAGREDRLPSRIGDGSGGPFDRRGAVPSMRSSGDPDRDRNFRRTRLVESVSRAGGTSARCRSWAAGICMRVLLAWLQSRPPCSINPAGSTLASTTRIALPSPVITGWLRDRPVELGLVVGTDRAEGGGCEEPPKVIVFRHGRAPCRRSPSVWP